MTTSTNKTSTNKTTDNKTVVTSDHQKQVQNMTTKSAGIRFLDKAGYTRSQIAKYMGIRYQHVRNVLVSPEPKSK